MRNPVVEVVVFGSAAVFASCGGSGSSSDPSATTAAMTATTNRTPTSNSTTGRAPTTSSVVLSTNAASPTPSTGQPAAAYQLDVTVIDDADSGPRLCFWILDSLPPQCDDPVIREVVGLDWDNVPAAESSQGTTWAELHLVGTWDGPSETVRPDRDTHGARPFERRSDPTFELPCPEPEGGWAEAPADEQGQAEAGDWLYGRADISAIWVASPAGSPEISALVVRVADGGDRADIERSVRERYSGPLCIVSGGRPEHELMAVLTDVEAAVGDEHLHNFLDSVAGHVVVTVMLATPELQETLDAQFGEGTVVLESALQPVE